MGINFRVKASFLPKIEKDSNCVKGTRVNQSILFQTNLEFMFVVLNLA